MSRKIIFVLLILIMAVATSCGGKTSRRDGDDMVGPLPPRGSGPMGPDAPVGPLPDEGYTPPKDAVVVVLGPGLARGLAHMGVLKEFEEKQLIVSAVVGVEMGALIGGIWASSNINTLEWEMYKFKRSTLLDVPLLSFGNRNNLAEGKAIAKFLDEALKVDSLQRMRVPVLVASAIQSESGVLIEKTGSAKDIIRGAISIPGLLKSYSWSGDERLSAATDTPFPVEEARAMGLGKVVCVDTLGRGDDFKPKDNAEAHLAALMKSAARIAREQLRQCDYVLSVPVAGVGYLDFDARADLIYKGQLAARKWLETMK